VSGRTFALLGSGEFEPWTDEVDRWLLGRADGDGTVLIAPTASAAEGDDVFDMWAGKGLEHFRTAGIPAEVVPLKVRDDAERGDLAARLSESSIVYFSGGNPYYLSEVLRNSTFYRTMVGRLDDGLAYAGCSAGVACLTEMTYDSDSADFREVFKPGLGYIRNTLFAPHWDIVDTWIPGARDFITASAPPAGVLVALDEDTAMLGDGTDWTVVGRQAVHLLRGGVWTEHAEGDGFTLELGR
jgi:cyanophycinase